MTDNIPLFIYGTAWKKEATRGLVLAALEAGFRGIDTANQPKHYAEALVGEALGQYFKRGGKRESLFIQTKFTPLNGHDARLPYDADAAIAQQVRQSFVSSLEHLGVDYLDSYLLHAPYNFPGIGEEDLEAWQALEEIYRSKKARFIGISNVNALQLAQILERAEIAPMVVQNRCCASRRWDQEVRELCKANGIIYQGFSLLTANTFLLSEPRLSSLCEKYKKTPAQIIFRFSRQIGILPLTGTASEKHMKEDLDIENFSLTESEIHSLL